MRMAFGIVSLLVALAVVGMVIKKQLAATRTAIPVLQPATAASEPANVRQQSQQVQDQYRKALEGALQQARPMPEDGK
ncbi:MAG: hypothetical protein WBA58_06835 [Giesbergeria sp.]